MVGTSSMAHGTARRVEGGLQAVDPLPGARGRHGRRRDDAPLGPRLAGGDRLRRCRQGVPLRADRRRRGALPGDQRLGLDGDRGQRELLQRPPRARRAALISLVFSYDAADPGEFERAYGPEGEWAAFFRGARGYVGTELLRDLELPGRYLVVDRWESREVYNDFVAAHREEYMRRVDETAFYHDHELRLGSFESVW